MNDGYWLNRYLCPLPGCGKHHRNGSKAQATCEAILAAGDTLHGQQRIAGGGAR